MFGHVRSDDSNGAGIASTFFIIASLVLSFLPLLWCLHALYVHYKSGGRKPIFLSFLLINILLFSVLSPAAILMYLRLDFSDACVRAFKLFQMTQLCGIFLHQLVALESVLSLRNPLYTTDLFSLPCTTMLSVTLYTLAIACVSSVSSLDFGVQFTFCLLSVLILTLTVFFTFKAPASPPPDPDTRKKTAYWVLAVATVTMAVAYLPFLTNFFILSCEINFGFETSQTALNALLVTPSLMSLRVISDAFLCVLVFKKILPVQTAQTQA